MDTDTIEEESAGLIREAWEAAVRTERASQSLSDLERTQIPVLIKVQTARLGAMSILYALTEPSLPSSAYERLTDEYFSFSVADEDDIKYLERLMHHIEQVAITLQPMPETSTQNSDKLWDAFFRLVSAYKGNDTGMMAEVLQELSEIEPLPAAGRVPVRPDDWWLIRATTYATFMSFLPAGTRV